MKSSSLKLAIEHGIPSPKEYRDAIILEWYLNPIHAERLVTYILLRVKTKELFERLADGEVYIEDKKYQAIWIDNPGNVRNSEWALISFRFCKYLEMGYALIKILKGNPENFVLLETKKE